MPKPTITAAQVDPTPETLWDILEMGPPGVCVTLSDGTQKLLFRFLPDVVSFTEEELLGLTEDQARELKYQKDLVCLRRA